ncbi:hypothetical protein [Paenibacillus abyssi]|nr:hypothetical protein [Paenibacillus abyssi]
MRTKEASAMHALSRQRKEAGVCLYCGGEPLATQNISVQLF